MFAQLTSVQANCHISQGKTPFSVNDFLPVWKGEERELTDEEEMMAMNAKFDAYNAKVAAMGIS